MVEKKIMKGKNTIKIKQLKHERQILFFWKREKQSLF